ncbi:MAG: hypothetical protein GWN18_13610, partial [Thermoplasmata archaeon]|nr:hypothetical protein [Thermoplasmata archaeon]NIT78454.1 hypothetical protein [Thermoplasmata archaeon]NIU50053.1 hypothetical protein [Thermoplasmata archaeon]NIW83563.1 hypothetical protein [Thermoplasmata archaeon]NIY04823.1 hypothetical protein [Thermoplasmata archaeon]
MTNVGDVHDTYWVEHVLLPDDSGWGVVVDKDTIRLDHKASVGVSVNLSSPASAKANDNCSVFLRVQSTTDASVWDGMKVLAIVDPDLHLELEAPVPSMLVDPGGTVEFPIVVRNAGNMPGKVTILVTSSEPRPGWYVLLDAGSLDLAGGEEQVLELTVTAPVDAVAGAQQTVKVTGVTEDLTSSSSVKVTAVVDEVYAVYPVISSNMVALHAGDEATVEMDVTNEGNTLQVLALGTALVPPGWMVTFEMDGAAVQDLALQARETRTVDVVISTPHDARAGVSPQIHIVLTDSEGRSQTLPFQVRIHHKYAVDISAPVHEGAGSPGGTIVYDLSVENMGNGVDTFTLDHGPLPGTGWSAVFTTTDGNIIDQVTLEVGETRNVRFSVNVPARVNAVGPMDLMVSATSTSAEKDEVKLSLSVDLPDLKIVSVTYDPPSTVLRGPIDV